MTTYGYCRISTNKQSIERQVRNIKSTYPDAVIVQEAYTGTTMDRREWDKLRKAVRPGGHHRVRQCEPHEQEC